LSKQQPAKAFIRLTELSLPITCTLPTPHHAANQLRSQLFCGAGKTLRPAKGGLGSAWY